MKRIDHYIAATDEVLSDDNNLACLGKGTLVYYGGRLGNGLVGVVTATTSKHDDIVAVRFRDPIQGTWVRGDTLCVRAELQIIGFVLMDYLDLP